MPFGMFQRRKNMTPGAGIVHEYHQRNSSAAEYIEGIITVVHIRFRSFEVGEDRY